MIKCSAPHPPRSTHQSLPSPVPSPACDHVPTPDSPPISNRLTSCHRPFLSLLFRLRLTPSEPSSLLILTLITSGCCFEKLVNKSPKNLASYIQPTATASHVVCAYQASENNYLMSSKHKYGISFVP